jgi:flagellar hook-basal body complex protein FliE
MTPIGSIGSVPTPPMTGIQDAMPPLLPPSGATPTAAPTDVFGTLLDNLVGTVNAKQVDASAQATQVMMGDSTQLHQSVIAMQEASVALSMMVQVRNKLVESYQELMRMQV